MREPVKRLRDYLAIGVVAYVIGAVVTFLAWPHSSGMYGEIHSGDMFFTIVGLVAMSGGAGCALVALIGLGVKFGREAAELD